MQADSAVPAPRRLAWTLLGVLIVAGLLRIPRLDRIPNGLIPDEALSAYDAYSIALTSRDSHGERLPLFPVSSARLHCLNMYLQLPFVAALGLDEWSARLPSAIAGLATVLLSYLLVRELADPLAGLFAAGFVAVSPWHVLLSRTGYDWNLLPAMSTVSVWLLVRALRHDAPLWPAGLAIGVSLYTYAPIRLSLPLLLVAVVLTHRRLVRRPWRRALPGLVLAGVLAAPVAAMMARSEGRQRLASIEAPADGALGTLRGAAGRYAASFAPGWLLAPAAEPALHRLRSTGLVSPFEALCLAAGIGAVLANRASPLPLLALAFTPLAVCIHKDAPDPVLCVVMLPWVQFLGALGLAFLWHAAARFGARSRAVLFTLAALAAATGVARMAQDLFRAYPVYSAPLWSHGVRDVVRGIEGLRTSRTDVVVDLDQKLISSLILFYSRYEPGLRQAETAQLVGRAERTRVGPYRLGDARSAAREPGSRLIWTTDARGRALGLTPLLAVPLPDGTPNHVLFVRSEREAR